MVVLSLFDGISCGRVALQRAGIPITEYYASEIDKYAMQISRKNWPDIVQLGGVEEVECYSGISVQREEISSDTPDILIGGSPCQGFSNSGEGLNFEDPRSKLFWEYVRILKEIRMKNPNVKFLLENVKMKKDWRDIISKALGVQPILINSALVSAQNRERYYWTNIEGVTQPEDKGILLKNVLLNFSDTTDLFHTEKAVAYMDRITGDGRNKWDFMYHSDSEKLKSACVTSNFLKGIPNNVLIDRSLARVRKFHPIECERLQTLPDNYTSGISSTQRYKSIGNGWTIDVISHILSFLK